MCKSFFDLNGIKPVVGLVGVLTTTLGQFWLDMIRYELVLQSFDINGKIYWPAIDYYFDRYLGSTMYFVTCFGEIPSV
jgi:hypothetical protein